MSDGAPLVSVCIPTYNYRHYLLEAVESALAQTQQNIEIVVVDNASTDGTIELLSELSARDRRIRFVRNPTNLGMTANFNRCLELAEGKYIKFLCADDVLSAKCVERMADIAERHPEVSLVGCARYLFDDRKRVVGQRGYSRAPLVADGRKIIADCFFSGNLIGEPTAVLFRNDDRARRFNLGYTQLLDLELWFRLLESGAFAFIPEALCGIRQHAAQGTGENLRAGRVVTDKVLLFDQFAGKQHGSLLRKLRWDARMASSIVRQGRVATGSALPDDVRDAVYHPGLVRAVMIPALRAARAIRGVR
ncbi:MAG: glycosyltransferase family 2 protein [Betaproteobacteria bacterium]